MDNQAPMGTLRARRRNTLGSVALRTQSDSRLVELAGQGHGAAFEEIVRRHRAPLVAYAATIVADHRAEDVVQTALMKAQRAIAQGGRALELRPYLFTIVRNTALNDLRDQPVFEHLDEDYDGVPQPPVVAERRDGLRALVAALMALPAAQREAIVKREFEGRGATFLSRAESDALAKVLVTAQRLPNPALVGKPATAVAAAAGISVPADTRVLIAPLDGVGRDYPLSIEKLCPVLSFYVVDDWKEGCERCIEILRYGGMGHTMSIHSRDDAIVLEFGLRKPASRIVVNTPTTLGSIGMTTGLDPAMTLGCGGYGGNITSDNISPMHLLNIKRLAYETHPAADLRLVGTSVETRPTTKPGIDPTTLAQRIDLFLSTRGVIKGERPTPPASVPPGSTHPPAPAAPPQRSVDTRPEPQPSPVEFVCEDDVRQAIEGTRSIVIDHKTIVTPAARDLAEQHHVFTHAGLSTKR